MSVHDHDPFVHVVSILAARREECLSHLEKLAKRGKRYGQAIAWTETPRTETRKFVGPDGKTIERTIERIDLTITGEAPRVGDFAFEAALERTPGGIIIAAVPGINVGKLGRDWDGRCDHCGNERHRVHGYLVRKGRSRKIVGKSCLRDYLGTDAPEKIAGRFTFLREIAGGEDEDGWGGFGGSWHDLTTSLIATARAAIKLYGWRKNDLDAYGWKTTLGIVSLAERLPIKPDDEQRKIFREMHAELRANAEAYAAEAEQIIEWARALQPRNDYQHNLKVALSGETIKIKHRGIAVSACAAFDRQKEVEAERKAKDEAEKAKRNVSDYLGQPGDRITAEIEVASKRVLPDRGFGERHLIKFFGPEDQVITWISGSIPYPIRKLDPGAKITATFTVKAHGEFRDVRETKVLRLKLVENERAAA